MFSKIHNQDPMIGSAMFTIEGKGTQSDSSELSSAVWAVRLSPLVLSATRSHRRLRHNPIHQELLPREGMHLAVGVAEEAGLVAAHLGGEVQLIEGGGAQRRWAE